MTRKEEISNRKSPRDDTNLLWVKTDSTDLSSNKKNSCHSIRFVKFVLFSRNSAFTLVEVLVVITILALLIGILAPSIQKAVQLARAAETRAYMQQLESGALQYQKDTGYFPGQEYADNQIGTGNNFTGSQVLGACVYGMALDTGDGEVNYLTGTAPTSPYVDFKSERVLSDVPSNSIDSFAPCDTFSDRRAILYYPSRLGNDGTVSAFSFGDNSELSAKDRKKDETDPTDPALETQWTTFITDNRFGVANAAYKADSFLLISAGIDRFFYMERVGGSNEDRTPDDLKNF